MKSLAKYILLSLFLLACQKDDPFLTPKNAVKGAYVKLVAGSETGDKLINILDQSSFDLSSYGYSVEFVDGEGGTRITKYILNVSYNDSIGGNSKDPILFKTYEANSFTLSNSGNLGVSDIELTSSEITAVFGLTINDLGKGDKFEFTGSLVTDDNQTFSSENTSPTIKAIAYFDFEIKVE